MVIKEGTQKEGCRNKVRISQVQDERLICGISTINGKLFYCDDCLEVVD